MKKRLTGATFDASAKTITHANFSDVTLAGIQLITNVTDNIVIYNFADPTKGGTLATDTLTLTYDTTSMSDTDELMILVEDGSATEAIAGTVDLGATDNAVLDAIAASVSAIDTDTTTVIGHLDGVETLLGTIDADTSNLSTKIDTLAGAVAGTEMQVDVVSSALPTGASTLAEQQSQTTHLATIAGDTTAIQTAVELLDDTVYTDGAGTPSKGILALGTDGTNPQAIKTDASGELQVDVLSMPTTTVTATDLDIRNLTATDVVTAELGATDNAVLDAIAASTAAIDADTTTIIGHVDGIEGLLTTIDADTSGIITSLQLIDDAIRTEDAAETAGTGLMMAGSVRRDTAASSAGTTGDNATINTDAAGKLWVTGTVLEDVAHSAGEQLVPGGERRIDTPATSAGTSGDWATANQDAYGLSYVHPMPTAIDLATVATPHVKKYYTNAGAVTDGIIWSPAAGKRWFVTDIIINTSAAATVTLEDDLAAGDSVVMKFELAANSGVSHTFQTPLYSGEDAADLLVTTSAGNIYVCITGYEI